MKVLLFANTDWYLYNFRLPLAQALRARGDEVVLVSPPGAYAERLQAAGFRWVAFPFSRRGTNPLREAATIWRLAEVYRRERPDLAHHFTIKCVLYGSLAARLAGVKRVVNAITGLGYVFTGTDRRARLLRPLVRGLYRPVLRGSQVIFQNPDDRDLFLREKLAQPDQIHLIKGSGVDVERFTPLPEPPGTPLVVLPARLLWAKGVGEFVEAARLLKARGVDVRMALVGDGDPHNPETVPPEQLDAWRGEGVVELWGWREDMPEVYRQTAVGCLPSYREGLPRTLIELAACGRPLVASDVPGCREIVRSGENGLLVPPRDAAALADAIQKLVGSAQLRTEMGKRGRALAQAEFSTAQVVSETVRVYNILAPNRP